MRRFDLSTVDLVHALMTYVVAQILYTVLCIQNAHINMCTNLASMLGS